MAFLRGWVFDEMKWVTMGCLTPERFRIAGLVFPVSRSLMNWKKWNGFKSLCPTMLVCKHITFLRLAENLQPGGEWTLQSWRLAFTQHFEKGGENISSELIAAWPQGWESPARRTGQASRSEHKTFMGILRTAAGWSPGLTFHSKRRPSPKWVEMLLCASLYSEVQMRRKREKRTNQPN